MNDRFAAFHARLERDVLSHPVIVANPYTAWFRLGDMSLAQARAFVVQFSVFSNQFLVAQLNKMLNADTVDEMRASKEILANELGVGFRDNAPSEDPELGSPTGSIEGGTFHFRAAHFELLTRMAKDLGLGFDELGKRRFATASTSFFCDELIRLYGHENYLIATASSWAVENWAAAGFWDELLEGWEKFRARAAVPKLNLAFFAWHARLEANHARHTREELAEFYAQHRIDEDTFVAYARQMLDAVHVFWTGLDQQRRAIATGAQDALHMAS